MRYGCPLVEETLAMWIIKSCAVVISMNVAAHFSRKNCAAILAEYT
jgi:hypothetical protein